MPDFGQIGTVYAYADGVSFERRVREVLRGRLNVRGRDHQHLYARLSKKCLQRNDNTFPRASNSSEELF